ncbi:ketopantoate reductase family protein [Tissierella sp.]|uniref:ketopantoate reductase family protein n=1 Tax=Tissierella sp. TaxID=41274 RepID=UPI00285BACCF|nr:ketopantoate reductase family protein [Tissierella sp.]MDR7855334.1 ketopantoate reductase family protein [Tissierella sp.]
MRTALMGVGSLGTIIGALVSKNGGEMTLIDANKEHVDALNKNGARVIGKLQLDNIPVKAITPEEMDGIYDIVIILAKQTYNDVVLQQLLPHLGANSVVCTLQNGVPEESVAKVIGEERTVGGIVGWGASYRGPGVSELTSDVSAMRYEIGEIDGSKTEQIEAVAKILNLAGTCVVMENLMGTRWAKVIQNATLSGMSAALGSTYAEILDNEKATSCAAHVGNEIVQIVRKRNIQLEDLVPGWSYYNLAFEDTEGLHKANTWLREYFKPHRLLKASMLQDMEKGIPCEIDHIVGICSEWGKKVGVPTPTCDTIIDIVKDFENGKIPMPTMQCLDRFNLPELK